MGTIDKAHTVIWINILFEYFTVWYISQQNLVIF